MPSKTAHHRPISVADQPAVYLVDATGTVQFVLVPAAQYRCVRPLLESDAFSIAESYPLQEQMARAAGWSDPAMDVYDTYDAHRPRP